MPDLEQILSGEREKLTNALKARLLLSTQRPTDALSKLAGAGSMSLPSLIGGMTQDITPPSGPMTPITELARERYSGKPGLAALDLLNYGPLAPSKTFREQKEVVNQLPIVLALEVEDPTIMQKIYDAAIKSANQWGAKKGLSTAATEELQTKLMMQVLENPGSYNSIDDAVKAINRNAEDAVSNIATRERGVQGLAREGTVDDYELLVDAGRSGDEVLRETGEHGAAGVESALASEAGELLENPAATLATALTKEGAGGAKKAVRGAEVKLPGQRSKVGRALIKRVYEGKSYDHITRELGRGRAGDRRKIREAIQEADKIAASEGIVDATPSAILNELKIPPAEVKTALDEVVKNLPTTSQLRRPALYGQTLRYMTKGLSIPKILPGSNKMSAQLFRKYSKEIIALSNRVMENLATHYPDQAHFFVRPKPLH